VGGANHEADYGAMAQRMVELAATMPGFLGVESVRDGSTPGSPGITVSYWRSPEDIAAWQAHAEHRVAQRLGRERWYQGFQLRVCKVERAYGFER
jgi:heme-degrading monooxygenase HmoA